jgi:hypothetical protein
MAKHHPNNTKEGAFFVDYASSLYVHVEHQFGFSAVDIISDNQSYERLSH